MKSKFIWLLLVIGVFLTITGCKKIGSTEPGNLLVERYIELLRANRYDSVSIPAFTYQDIPSLLSYRNESQMISNFPRNPISSYYNSQCKLGIYVLWTIESIRAVSINSKFVILRFPSQNSVLALRNADFGLVEDAASHETAANAYYLWWENNRRRDFSDFANVDPLAGTAYKWH
jgi:hypothetical protein